MCDTDKTILIRPHHQPGDVTLLTDERDRLFQKRLRRLLEHRDQDCALPGCDRPPSWCHAHHIAPWAKGRPTTLHNGVLLRGHHHRLTHQAGWTIHLARDRLPEFTPPNWTDPQQPPLHHQHHTTTTTTIPAA